MSLVYYRSYGARNYCEYTKLRLKLLTGSIRKLGSWVLARERLAWTYEHRSRIKWAPGEREAFLREWFRRPKVASKPARTPVCAAKTITDSIIDRRQILAKSLGTEHVAKESEPFKPHKSVSDERRERRRTAIRAVATVNISSTNREGRLSTILRFKSEPNVIYFAGDVLPCRVEANISGVCFYCGMLADTK